MLLKGDIVRIYSEIPVNLDCYAKTGKAITYNDIDVFTVVECPDGKMNLECISSKKTLFRKNMTGCKIFQSLVDDSFIENSDNWFKGDKGKTIFGFSIIRNGELIATRYVKED